MFWDTVMNDLQNFSFSLCVRNELFLLVIQKNILHLKSKHCITERDNRGTCVFWSEDWTCEWGRQKFSALFHLVHHDMPYLCCGQRWSCWCCSLQPALCFLRDLHPVCSISWVYSYLVGFPLGFLNSEKINYQSDSYK